MLSLTRNPPSLPSVRTSISASFLSTARYQGAVASSAATESSGAAAGGAGRLRVGNFGTASKFIEFIEQNFTANGL